MARLLLDPQRYPVAYDLGVVQGYFDLDHNLVGQRFSDAEPWNNAQFAVAYLSVAGIYPEYEVGDGAGNGGLEAASVIAAEDVYSSIIEAYEE